MGSCSGWGATLFDSAAQSMTPAVVAHDSQQLKRANGQLGAAMMVTQEMAGPAVGGAVFAVAASVPFAADAVSFGASSALIASIRGSFKPQREPASEGRRRLRTEIGEGLRWLAGHRLLRTLAMMGGVANLVFMAGDAILVLFVQDKLGLGSAGFGLLLTAFALGGLPGSLLAARISSRLPAGVVVIGGLLLWAVLYLVFGLASRRGWPQPPCHDGRGVRLLGGRHCVAASGDRL